MRGKCKGHGAPAIWGILPKVGHTTQVQRGKNTVSSGGKRSTGWVAMGNLKILNIEAGLPTVEEARSILLAELKQAKQSGVKAIKVIHGYGSTGKGGALRGGLRTSLLRRKKRDS